MALRIDRLVRHREEQGWSKREFARLCGMKELQIYRYENGLSDPSTDNLKTLADVLKVSSDYLLGLSHDPHLPVRDTNLPEDERIMLETYRREGWEGVIHLSA